MNKSTSIIFIFCVCSQFVFSQDDMIGNLRRKTLSEYVASCEYDEEKALIKLLQFEMPQKISKDYRWYTRCDIDQDYCILTHQSYNSQIGSLQLKAFSWIIRIFNGDYDDCAFYRYDFGYDYVISPVDRMQYIQNNKTNEIKAKLTEWTIDLNRYGLDGMRKKRQPPIFPHYYKLRLIHHYPSYTWRYDSTIKEDTFDVLYYLKNKTLKEYVAICDSNIVLAIRRLQRIDMPKECSDSLMWYSEQDKLKYYKQEDIETPRRYASLKQKAYSWIIRIYFDAYQECGDYFDFGYYDYEIAKDKGIGNLKKVENNKEVAIDDYIKEWFNKNNWYLFLHERDYSKAPIRIKDYCIMRNQSIP